MLLLFCVTWLPSCSGADTKSKKSVLERSSGRKDSLISMLVADDVISLSVILSTEYRLDSFFSFCGSVLPQNSAKVDDLFILLFFFCYEVLFLLCLFFFVFFFAFYAISFYFVCFVDQSDDDFFLSSFLLLCLGAAFTSLEIAMTF